MQHIVTPNFNLISQHVSALMGADQKPVDLTPDVLSSLALGAPADANFVFGPDAYFQLTQSEKCSADYLDPAYRAKLLAAGCSGHYLGHKVWENAALPSDVITLCYVIPCFVWVRAIKINCPERVANV